MSSPPPFEAEWFLADRETAAAFKLLSEPPRRELDAGVRKRQRLAMGRLIAALAESRAWQRLPPLLAAVERDALLPPEQFKFAVKTLRAAVASDFASFARAVWPPPDAPDPAAAAVVGALFHRFGLGAEAAHYLEAARSALGASLPAAALHNWCRIKLAASAYADVVRETAGRCSDPSLALVHAEALNRLGEHAQAVATLEKLVPTADSLADAANRLLIRISLGAGRPEEAEARFNAVASPAPDAPSRVDRELLRLDILAALGRPRIAALEAVDVEAIDANRRERLVDRTTRALLLDHRVEEAMALLSTPTKAIDLLRKTIVGGILVGDLESVRRAERALAAALVERWRPGRPSPGYNQHLLFARNTRLNAAFDGHCREIRGLADVAALPRIRSFIEGHPCDYSAAIQLVFRLSRVGLLSQPPESRAIDIPRHIVFFWDETRRPAAVDELIATWRRMNRDFAVSVFDDASAGEFLAARFGERHARALRRCRHAAMKADLFRLCYLYDRGGIYADCDDRCRAPIDDWLEGRDAVLYQENHMRFAVANNFIAATPGRPYLATAIEQALIALEAPVRSFTFYVAGPGMLTMCFAQWASRQEPAALRRTRLLSGAAYARKVSSHLRLPYKDTSRHWVRQEGAGV
jgi:hypothetical protein